MVTDTPQLLVLADIRAAIGDNGKLMHDELVARIRELYHAATIDLPALRQKIAHGGTGRNRED